MKFSFAWVAGATSLALIAWSSAANAQGPGPASGGTGATRPAGASIAPVSPRAPGTSVAVIDISQVFEKHVRFQDQMKALKAEVEEFEQSLKTEQKSMTELRDQLQQYQPGSKPYKDIEEKMAKLGSDVNVKMALQRKEFLEKEAKVYYNTYNQVFQVVSAFADRNGIGLVLRFNSEEMKPEDRASVLQGVNRAVVFQRNLNITNLIIKEINGGVIPDTKGVTPGTAEDGTARRQGSTSGLR